MLIQELLPDVNLETNSTEFKARLETGLDRKGEDNELKWLKEISAFANTSGGTIYVGVNDKSHEIESLSHEEVDATIKLLYQALRQRVEPELKPFVQEIGIPNTFPMRYILAIAIPPSPVVPVYVHVNGVPATYIRDFASSPIATPEQIASMVLRSEKSAYDKPFTSTKYRKEDFSLFYKRLKEVSGKDDLPLDELETMGFVDDRDMLSKGALLFRDDCSNPATTIKISVYPGITQGSDMLLAEKTLIGPIFRTIDDAKDFIESHSVVGYRKTPNGREDFYSYPTRSLLEGIANAVAHRNYFIDGAFIEINMFIDRLEITSPGSLLGGRTLSKEKNIVSIRPKHRNAVICKGLNCLRYIEAKGSGFDLIDEEYMVQGESHKPFVSADADSFTLTLPNLSYANGVIGDDNPYPTIHLPQFIVSEYDEKILSCCYQKERGLAEIASFIGVAPSTYLRTKILAPLVEKGYLASWQKGKGIVYRTIRKKIDFFVV